MTNEIPLWWLILSAIFFIVAIVLVVILAIVGLKVVEFLNTVKPKVDEISGKVSDLVVKVEHVAVRVEEVATSVKDAVEGVGGRAKGVAGSVELIASSGARQFEKFSPIVVGIMTALRLAKSVSDFRSSQKHPNALQRHVPAKKGGIFGLFGKH